MVHAGIDRKISVKDSINIIVDIVFRTEAAVSRDEERVDPIGQKSCILNILVNHSQKSLLIERATTLQTVVLIDCNIHLEKGGDLADT